MDNFPNSKVISTLAALNWLQHDTSRSEIIEKFSLSHPHLVDRVIFSSDQDMDVEISQMLDSNSPPSLMYCLFLNNAENLLNNSEEFQVPFVFTLYPGGGFHLNNSFSDDKLLRVLSSNMLKGVVVTMPTTLDYVQKFISKFSLSSTKIIYKYGGIIRQPKINNIKMDPIAGPLRVLFIGMKYTEKGEDKGLDLFLSSCSLLIQSGIKLNISIVGNWSQIDLNGFLCESYCTIFGLVPNEELSNIYFNNDIAIFPTRYSKIDSGNFDGFPVGSAIEAALHGVAIMTTNPLGMVTPLRSGIHYISIDPTTDSIYESILDLDKDRDHLLRLKIDGQKKFYEIFSLHSQMYPRLELLKKFLT